MTDRSAYPGREYRARWLKRDELLSETLETVVAMKEARAAGCASLMMVVLRYGRHMILIYFSRPNLTASACKSQIGGNEILARTY